MTGYLTYLMVAAQEADVAARAHRAPRPEVVRIRRRPPRRLRIRTARPLVGLAP